MNWIDYREKLGIGFNDDEKFKMLKNKTSIFLDLFGPRYSEDSYKSYAIMVGERLLNHSNYPIFGLEESLINKTKSMKDFLSKYIAFYNTYDEKFSTAYGYREPPISKDIILNFMKTSLDNLRIQYEIFEDDDGVFIFPKGVSDFDNSLVSKPLQWLSTYPTAEKAWSKAMREYAESSEENASDVADKYRKALEAFFQEFFKSQKSLENFKAEYGDYLKQRGIPKEIAGNFETLLQAYTNYINNFAKHRDATSDKILEYLMYQTGNIMRLLLTL